jgi:hypothetical protein
MLEGVNLFMRKWRIKSVTKPRFINDGKIGVHYAAVLAVNAGICQQLPDPGTTGVAFERQQDGAGQRGRVPTPSAAWCRSNHAWRPRTLPAGASDYLSKPVSLKTLRDVE